MDIYEQAKIVTGCHTTCPYRQYRAASRCPPTASHDYTVAKIRYLTDTHITPEIGASKLKPDRR